MEHIPKASKILENKLPSTISKKKFIENLVKVKEKFISNVKVNQSNATIDLSNPSNKHIFYRSNRNYVKNIHDKFNTAIRFDQNWGLSTKVATEIAVDIKRKNIDINYRKIRSTNKTPSDLGPRSQQRARVPKHNNSIGQSFGLSRQLSELPNIELTGSFMRNSNNIENMMDKKSRSFMDLSGIKGNRSRMPVSQNLKNRNMNNPYSNL